MLTLFEMLFDSSLTLSPHIFLLDILFQYRAFEAPSLTSPEHMRKLGIHPGEQELLKESTSDMYVFSGLLRH